jgi:hypothetical protein
MTKVTGNFQNAKIFAKNIDQADLDTQLLDASGSGFAQAVKEVLEQSANPNARDSFRNTPLMRAAPGDYTATLLTLLENGADPTLRNDDNETALLIAIRNGGSRGAKILKDILPAPLTAEEREEVKEAAALAIHNGFKRVYSWVMFQIVSTREERQDARTELSPTQHSALDRDLFSACRDKNYDDACDCLLEGADPNTVDSDGDTPLIWHAAEGDQDMAYLLLEAGADPYKKNPDGEDSLIMAIAGAHTTVAKMIWKHSPPELTSEYRAAIVKAAGEALSRRCNIIYDYVMEKVNPRPAAADIKRAHVRASLTRRSALVSR